MNNSQSPMPEDPDYKLGDLKAAAEKRRAPTPSPTLQSAAAQIARIITFDCFPSKLGPGHEADIVERITPVLAKLVKERDDAQRERDRLDTELFGARMDLATARTERDAAVKRLSESPFNQAVSADVQTELSAARQEASELREEVERLKSNVTSLTDYNLRQNETINLQSAQLAAADGMAESLIECREQLDRMTQTGVRDRATDHLAAYQAARTQGGSQP